MLNCKVLLKEVTSGWVSRKYMESLKQKQREKWKIISKDVSFREGLRPSLQFPVDVEFSSIRIYGSNAWLWWHFISSCLVLCLVLWFAYLFLCLKLLSCSVEDFGSFSMGDLGSSSWSNLFLSWEKKMLIFCDCRYITWSWELCRLFFPLNSQELFFWDVCSSPWFKLWRVTVLPPRCYASQEPLFVKAFPFPPQINTTI